MQLELDRIPSMTDADSIRWTSGKKMMKVPE